MTSLSVLLSNGLVLEGKSVQLDSLVDYKLR
jgi:hypothetical protein